MEIMIILALFSILFIFRMFVFICYKCHKIKNNEEIGSRKESLAEDSIYSCKICDKDI